MSTVFRKLVSAPQDTLPNLTRKIVDLLAVGLGAYGADRYTTGTHPGQWRILHAIADSVVNYTRAGTVVSNVTIKAGDRLFGEISTVTVTSGDVELYRAP